MLLFQLKPSFASCSFPASPEGCPGPGRGGQPHSPILGSLRGLGGALAQESAPAVGKLHRLPPKKGFFQSSQEEAALPGRSQHIPWMLKGDLSKPAVPAMRRGFGIPKNTQQGNPTGTDQHPVFPGVWARGSQTTGSWWDPTDPHGDTTSALHLKTHTPPPEPPSPSPEFPKPTHGAGLPLDR